MKRNKRGFTLVELIAVIAILAILMVLALPQVIKLYNDGVKNAFITEARSIHREATKQFLVDKINRHENMEYCVGDSSKVNALDIKGGDNVRYRVTFSGEEMTYFVVDNGRFRIELTSDFSIDDIKMNSEGGFAESSEVICETVIPDTGDEVSGGTLWEKILEDNPNVYMRGDTTT